MVDSIEEMNNKIPYVDSLKRKKKLGWKMNRKIKTRNEIYQYIYKDLIETLFSNFNQKNIRLVVVGPSNEEIQFIRDLADDKKYKIIIIEPDADRCRELENEFFTLENIKIIKDYAYNIKRYNIKTDIAIVLNNINWKPTNPQKFLKNLYSRLSDSGIIIISIYIETHYKPKDKKYIIKTPLSFKNILDKNSIEIFNEIYSDYNGILKVYVLNKESLKNIINYIENRIREIAEEIKFYNIY